MVSMSVNKCVIGGVAFLFRVGLPIQKALDPFIIEFNIPGSKLFTSYISTLIFLSYDAIPSFIA
jgi:hypothetical protein